MAQRWHHYKALWLSSGAMWHHYGTSEAARAR
jgi:hypothetical protein